MKDDDKSPSEAPQPQMLAMHKEIAKTSDGTRELIFYTFAEASTERKA